MKEKEPIITVKNGGAWMMWREKTMHESRTEVCKYEARHIWNNPSLQREDIKYIALKLLLME